MIGFKTNLPFERLANWAELRRLPLDDRLDRELAPTPRLEAQGDLGDPAVARTRDRLHERDVVGRGRTRRLDEEPLPDDR